MRPLDPVEQAYEHRMARTIDTDELHELSIGLSQYREMFMVPQPEKTDGSVDEGQAR